MKNTETLSEHDVIVHLGGATRAASLREIAHALGLRHAGRRALKKIIAKLKRRHEIEEVQNGRYKLAGKKAGEWQSSRGAELQSGRAKTPHAAREQGGAPSAPLPSAALGTSRAGEPPHCKAPMAPNRPEAGASEPERKLERTGGTSAVRDDAGFPTMPGQVPADGTQVREGAGLKPAPAKEKPAERRDPNVVTGRIVTHKDGYGFVLPDEPVPGMEGDLFIGRDALGDAMHGDRVQARIERRGTRIDRGQRVGRAEGRVVRILKRAHATVVGEFHYDLRPFGRERGNYVIPFDARLKQEIVIPPGEELTRELLEKVGLTAVREKSGQAESLSHAELTAELREKLGPSATLGTSRAGEPPHSKGRPAGRPYEARGARLPELDGAVVNVEITRFPGGGLGAAGRVVEILGRTGDIGVDTEIIIRKHHLPHEFPEEVLEEATAIPQEVKFPEGTAESARLKPGAPVAAGDRLLDRLEEPEPVVAKREAGAEGGEASPAPTKRRPFVPQPRDPGKQAAPAESGVEPPHSKGREDFRQLPIVTIDGDTAKDFDDAVHVKKLPDGSYELQVHIADVAHYVRRGSALDREARVRGTSVYFPNRAVPMLPEALSNGICSLNPKVDRLVMSAVMEMDAQGKMLRARFTPGVIRSVERMTYTNVNKVLEGEPEMTGRYAALAERFRLMKELALILNERRNKRGSIDFDLPEPVIEFDEMNRMKSIVRSERNIANRIIEEFMLAANEAVANFLEKRGITSLHRVHEKPDAKKVLEFEELAKAFGYTLGVEDLAEKKLPVKHGRVQAPARHGKVGSGRMRAMTVTLPPGTEINIRPQHYQALVRKIEGKPEERILSYLMLRSLKQARYEAEPLGHFALACDEYTHFTSPIRRYPDLIVHRLLKRALEKEGIRGETEKTKGENRKAKIGEGAQPFVPQQREQGKQAAPLESGVIPKHRELHSKAGDLPVAPTEAQGSMYRMAELEEVAAESSEAERRADTAERELMDWKTAQFMEQHLGDEYTGLIISVHKFGFFVELLEIFVEGLVPIGAIEEFTGGGCFYRESDRAILIERGGRRGGRVVHGAGGRRAPGANVKAFRLGDRVRLRAERIDPFQKRVEFALVSS